MEKKIKIHVFHTGEVGVDPAVPFRDVSRNPIAYTGLFRSKKRRIMGADRHQWFRKVDDVEADFRYSEAL